MSSSDQTARVYSVHELSEFVYCRRAGTIAVEAKQEDFGEEGRPINLGYLPRYSLLEIEARISQGMIALLVLLGIALVAFIGLGISLLNGYTQSFRIFQATLGLSLLASFLDVIFLVRLLWRRRDALKMPAREPQFLSDDGAVPIHWWELRAAGFEVRRFQDVLFAEEHRIKGRPWAILVRGTDCIPVLRKHGENPGIYPNHLVRIAGYCQLIETVTNYDSPYGIILLPGRLDAMAVPYSPAVQAKLRGALEIADQAMAQFPEPDPPADDRICLTCPHAQLRRYVAGKSDTVYQGQPLPPLTVVRDGVHLHTTCGDRFRTRDLPTLRAIDGSR